MRAAEQRPRRAQRPPGPRGTPQHHRPPRRQHPADEPARRARPEHGQRPRPGRPVQPADDDRAGQRPGRQGLAASATRTPTTPARSLVSMTAEGRHKLTAVRRRNADPGGRADRGVRPLRRGAGHRRGRPVRPAQPRLSTTHHREEGTDAEATTRRLGRRLRLRHRVHGHRPGRPDPEVDRRAAGGDAEPGLADVHQLHGDHGRRDAGHRRRLQPDRRQAHPALRPRADHRLRRARRVVRTPSARSSASAPAGAWATRCSSPPRWPPS